MQKMLLFSAARWQKPYSLDPSRTLGNAVLSDGGYRHGRPWVYWSFLIIVAYLVLLVLLTALALKFLNRELPSPNWTATHIATIHWLHPIHVHCVGYQEKFRCTS